MSEVVIAILTIGLPAVGAFYLGISRLLTDYAKQIAMLAEIRETTRITSIAVENLRMIDTDILRSLDISKQKISDLEEYLILLSNELQGTVQLHPFKIRGR